MEEFTYKQIAKLAKQATNNSNVNCTMVPIWKMLKTATNEVATVHLEVSQQLASLVKQVNKYVDELQKKCKGLKETESGTMEAVQSLQNFTQTLFKAKDTIIQRTSELQKLKLDNAPSKDLEKCEKKLEKVTEEYKDLYLRYLTLRQAFETKMKGSFAAFRRHEWKHLCTVQKYVSEFIDIILCLQLKLEHIQINSKKEADELSVQKLVNTFAEENQSGQNDITVLAPAEVEEMAQSLSLQSGTDNGKQMDPTGSASEVEVKVSKREGFFGQRGKMKNRLKKKPTITSTTSKEEISESTESKEVEEANATMTSQENKDDEGYSEQPRVESMWQNSHTDTFYSSSGSDSEDETQTGRKLHVEIKPLDKVEHKSSLTNDEELQKCVEKLKTLESQMTANFDSSNIDPSFKRSQSMSQQLGGRAQTNTDWSQSSRSLNISGMADLVMTDVRLDMSSTLRRKSPSITSPFGDSGDMKSRTDIDKNRATPTSSIAIPRPPSRRSDPKTGAIPRTFMSPTKGILHRFETNDTEVKPNVSRGPSPLTSVSSDIVPVAIAFHEIIHAAFKGIDANEPKCQVKIMGDLTVSFPANAVALLLANPKYVTLTFKINNVNRLEKIVPNAEIVSSKINNDEMLVEFNMAALIKIFVREASKAQSKQYFIVDICKYEVKTKSGADSCPFQLVAYWQSRAKFTNLKIIYKYNSHAMSNAVALKDVKISVSMDEDVKNLVSRPRGTWLGDTRQAQWTMSDVPLDWDENFSKILGKFENFDETTIAKPTLINIHFTCDGASLSGLELELTSTSGYHVSLIKRKFISGQYTSDVFICGADVDLN